MDEKYRRIRGQWRYLYTAVDKNGNTVDVLRAHRGKTAARRNFEKTTAQNGVPETATNDKNGASLAALKEINADREAAIKIPTSLRSTSSGDLICGK